MRTLATVAGAARGTILGGMTALGLLDQLRGKRRQAELVWFFGGLLVAVLCVYQGWRSGRYGGPLRNLSVYAGLPLGRSFLLVWRVARD